MNMRAFTLIETLVYIALFTILMGGVLTSIESIRESNERNQARALLSLETSFLSEKIANEIEVAETVTSPAPDTSSVILSLRGKSDIRMEFDTGELLIGKDGEVTVPLSSNLVVIDSGRFTRAGVRGSITDPEHIDYSFHASLRTSEGREIEAVVDRTIYTGS